MMKIIFLSLVTLSLILTPSMYAESQQDNTLLKNNIKEIMQVPPHYTGSKEAGRIVDIAMEAARIFMIKAYTEEITEADVIDEIVRVILENGGDPYVSAFWSGETDNTEEAGLIVASGNDSAIPHGNYDNDDTNLILQGEVVVVDIGVRYQGRCSDETRTFFMGEPTEKQRKVYEIVSEAQQLAEKEITQLLQVKVLDKIARDHITQEGYGEKFLHGLGHGVGYYIHEPPMITQTSPYGEQPLHLWDVITIEPAIYLQDEEDNDSFGIRIEDDFGVLMQGYEKLTFYPSDIESMIIKPEDQTEEENNDKTFFESNRNSRGIIIGVSFIAVVAIVYTAYKKKKFSDLIGKWK